VIDHVADGDTVALRNGQRVRLVQIDTPEVYFGTECYGPQASATTKAMTALIAGSALSLPKTLTAASDPEPHHVLMRAAGVGARSMNDTSADPSGTAEAGSSFEVVVIGAGQAGLAMGYFLGRQGRRFVILDAADSIGAAWRTRWESLTLFTPRRYSGLPGLPFPGDPEGYPTRDEVIAYLEQYAQTFDLPIKLDSRVRRLSSEDGRFLLEVDGGPITADQVVVATGPFQMPFVPEFAGRLAPDVFQVHSTEYRKPSDVPDGTVLLVGGGNTGFQIAKELAAAHRVCLAVGSRQTPLPQRFLGRDLFWWLTKTGMLNKTVESRLGRKLRHRDTLIGSSPRELRQRYGVELKPRAVDASGRVVRFEDGSDLEVDALIWATGYRPDYAWIELPVLDPDGRVLHRRGVTDVPGLYLLGLTWQHTRGSALIGWVKDDAAFIAEQIGTFDDRRNKPAIDTRVSGEEAQRAGAGAGTRED
jgi:putative flavoprotein involved in K+ transport